MAFFRQYGRMCIIFLKLKSWKVLFMVAVIAALISNHFLYQPVSTWLLHNSKKDMHSIAALEFQRDNLVVSDTNKYDDQLQEMSNYVTTRSNKSFEKNFVPCVAGRNCEERYFRLLAAQGHDRIIHYVDYTSEKDARIKVKCQIGTGYELYCPYIFYLVTITHNLTIKMDFQYRQLRIFRLLDVVKPINVTQFDDICATDINFPSTYPQTLMTQTVLVALSLTFYLLVSTVTCIYELKQNGFLQLMYRRGLSIIAYWLALWTITLVEMVLFAAILVISYHFQCPKSFSATQLIKVFQLALLQFCCFASFVFLGTVLTRRISLESLFACIVCKATVAVAIVVRLVLKDTKKDQNLRTYLLAAPLGHFGEQVFVALQRGAVASMSVSLTPIVCGVLLGVAVILAIYLDFVLKSGSGRMLPLLFPLLPRFWSAKYLSSETLEAPQVTFMTDSVSLDPVLCLERIRKTYKTPGCCQRTDSVINLSAQFYKGQITAIVGHNGSGKSTLMKILSGERKATSGKVSLNKLLITDPVCRYHLGQDISYCPQSDALVNRLTPWDILTLTVSSANLEWDDAVEDLNNSLCALQIDDKKYICIHALSSSDQRKLCVAMALIGKPTLILLDHPSRDMDYVSKRRMWKLIHEHKMERVIIFSTWFMDEADGMADRLMLLCGGRIICSGSSFFLKRVFDCRYIIQIASGTEFHVTYILRKITSKFSSVRVRSVMYANLEIEVPITEDRILADVIAEVESMAEIIAEFGIANFCLDDVFTKLKDLSAIEIFEHCNRSTIGYLADDNDRIQALKSHPKLSLPGGPHAIRISRSIPSSVLAFMTVAWLQIVCSKARMLFRVIVPGALVLLVCGAAFMEMRAKNSDTIIRYNIINPDNFPQRGMCMFYYDSTLKEHYDRISDEECIRLLSGRNTKSDPAVTNMFVSQLMTVDKKSSLDLELVKYLPKIRTHCSKTLAPCSIAFASDWCVNKSVSQYHVMNVGTYVRSTNYSTESVVTNSVEVLRNLITNLTFSLTKGTSVIRPELDIEGIQGITNLSYNFYGLFVQIAVLAVMPIICFVDAMQDKLRGVKRQLISMGMSKLYYWICNLIAHWIQLAIIYLLSTAPLILLISHGYSSGFYFAAVVAPTVTLGLVNSLLCVYVLSVMVSSSNYFVATAVYIFCSLLISLSAILVQVSDRLGQIMIYISPHYAIIAPAFYGVKVFYYATAYYKNHVDPSLLPLIFGPGRHRDSLIALCIHCVLLIVLLIIVETWHKIRTLCRYGGRYKAEPDLYEGSREKGLLQERRQIENEPHHGDNILEVLNLKMYSSNSKLPLRNLTVSVKKGESVGLLGPSGSGKSYAIRAIIGTKRPTAGKVDVQLQDEWVSSDRAAQQGFTGYCPKYNPVIDTLTVRHNLQFYLRTNGISEERMQHILQHFRLTRDVNTVVMRAAAGVQRRLTMAIAVLPSPHFIAIDQASNGVDPAGRQELWETITSLASKQRGIIVSTKEMEEAERLCDRICILNYGSMIALNSVKEFIDRYRRLYMLDLQIAGDCEKPHATKAAITDQILKRFNGAIAIEQLTSRMQFAIPILALGSLSNALRWLVSRKAALSIVYFSLHYASIDQTMKAIVLHHNSGLLAAQQGMRSSEEASESKTVAV